MPTHKYKKTELIRILDNILNKTLGEIDVNNVFDKTINNNKITGIAGDVIENSVLGYASNNSQQPDLIVDGIEVELKTTGIKKSKKKPTNFEAKEPMSITAVSPNKIINETFDTSNFWHKLERLLLVYYFYDSDTPVKAAEYAHFYIKGYDFYEFSKKDKIKLKEDWMIVQSFIKQLNKQFKGNANKYYGRISSELRDKLMLIDTAPKWPHNPRFRLKRSTVSTMVKKYFGEHLEDLDNTYYTYHDLDKELHNFTNKYYQMTIKQLMELFNIPIKLNKTTKDVSKSVTEQIVIKMFGAKSKKLNQIEDFSQLGLIAKTITQTIKGERTEDIKFFPIEFDEFTTKIPFEKSSFYAYFSEQQFLCIIFEEPKNGKKLLENKFLGFKRMTFSDDFINNDVRNTWNTINCLINKRQLKDIKQLDKYGNVRINAKTGTIMSAPNFPKSRNHNVFVRGSGINSTKKTYKINGISMYKQYIWVKGIVFLNLLKKIDFI